MELQVFCARCDHQPQMVVGGLCYNVGVMEQIYYCAVCECTVKIKVCAPITVSFGADNRPTGIKTK